MNFRLSLFAGIVAIVIFAESFAAEPKDWQKAIKPEEPTGREIAALMRKWTEYVVAHHVKRTEKSPQRGMVYEYFDVAKKGQFDQFVQGEQLDTMHDGAWLIAALCEAYRVNGDKYYKEIVTRDLLPFYLKMLNHSDELFTTKRNDARPKAPAWDKEHGLIDGEKGFVPYYWDDGGSVSLERRRDKNPLAIAPSLDNLAGKPNEKFLLDGYSQGSSNHLAQDLGLMLLASWEMLRKSDDPADKQLVAEIAVAAKNLHESRMHHHGFIPMVAAAHARISNDLAILKRLDDLASDSHWKAGNHYTAATIDFKPGQRYPTPGFMDNQEYFYYSAFAPSGEDFTILGHDIPRPLAFRLVYDALTEPILFDRYYDDAPRPAGINRFDLYPFYYKDGKPEHLRSEKKGAFNQPVPIGSRMGPQTMVVCGRALFALRRYPGLWEEGIRRGDPKRFAALPKTGKEVAEKLRRELAGGLRTWEAIFDTYGYIPTGIGRGPDWDCFSDAGGYAHLIKAAAIYTELGMVPIR